MSLPADALPYRRTPDFDETTLPAGLKGEHATRDGVWAVIHVLEGQLAYRTCDARRPAGACVLTPERPPGVVEPTIVHSVAPLGAVRFYIEFHRQLGSGLAAAPAPDQEPHPCSD